MKDKILVFIIGVLVGAIIATSVFFVYEKNNSSNTESTNQTMQMRDGEAPPDMPDGERPDGESDGKTPPEKPDGENNNGGNPPERPMNNKTSNDNKTNRKRN